MTEEAQNKLFSSVIHEFGHALGLRHGGFTGRNCKPNYPSDMNYAYFPSFRLDGDFGSLATSKSQYSTGDLAPIVESSVSELDPLGAPFGTVSFLEVFGGTTAQRYLTFQSSNGRTDVDWDRSGGINGGPPPVPVRTGGNALCTDTTFQTIKDNNDAQTVVDSLDDPARLAQPGSGSSGAWVAAGETETVCGSPESTDAALASSHPRPWVHADSRRRLEEITGLAAEALRTWATEAGFDTTQRSEILRLEKLLEGSAIGRTAKQLLKTFDRGRSTAWLSEEDAEQEVIERGRELLQESLGRSIDLSFVDCPMRPETARDPGAWRSEPAILEEAVNGSLDQIQLCR